MALLPSILAKIARQNLLPIYEITFEHWPNRISIYNQVRKQFNLGSQREAVDLFSAWESYVKLDEVSSLLRCLYTAKCDEFPIDPLRRPIFNDESAWRVHLLVHIGEARCSRWVDFTSLPTHDMLASAAQSVAEQCANEAPAYQKAMQILGGGPIYFEVVSMVRLK